MLSVSDSSHMLNRKCLMLLSEHCYGLWGCSLQYHLRDCVTKGKWKEDCQDFKGSYWRGALAWANLLVLHN